ncbi:MAG: AgmX/PglI C-terminal domain-containing protein, partial [Halobacteriovoraceae bacterium]|nr:AgmX/PglI C-terminal domain-containing protein [Halobacteriovoraceae bacterium]
NKKTNVKKAGDKKSTKVGKIKKATPNKGPKDVKKNIVRPTTAKKAGGKRGSRNVKKASSAITKSKGSVDTYKSFDFKSTVSSLISKGGSTKTAKAVAADASGSTSNTSISDANPGATLKTAKVSKNTGSLSGVASGKLDTAKGVEGLVNKKSIYTAGLPYKTVIVGGIDPDVIRQILIENIPRFRYCYQKVLDRSKAAFNGIVRLNFIIGASGHVTKAGVDSISSLPSTVKGCVVNVLRKISFPPPMGGGVVEVNQPMNFYPRVK